MVLSRQTVSGRHLEVVYLTNTFFGSLTKINICEQGENFEIDCKTKVQLPCLTQVHSLKIDDKERRSIYSYFKGVFPGPTDYDTIRIKIIRKDGSTVSSVVNNVSFPKLSHNLFIASKVNRSHCLNVCSIVEGISPLRNHTTD